MKLIIREALEEFRSFSGERNCCLGKWKPAVLPPLSLIFKLPGILCTLTWLADYRLTIRNTEKEVPLLCKAKGSGGTEICRTPFLPTHSSPSHNRMTDGDKRLKTKLLSRRTNKLGTSRIPENNFTKSYPSVTVICTGLPVDDTCSISAPGQSLSGLLRALWT